MPAALERTDGIDVGTGLNAVLRRYHPANVAHRLATLMELYPDRLFLGIGTGGHEIVGEWLEYPEEIVEMSAADGPAIHDAAVVADIAADVLSYEEYYVDVDSSGGLPTGPSPVTDTGSRTTRRTPRSRWTSMQSGSTNYSPMPSNRSPSGPTRRSASRRRRESVRP
jgi:hypothetical protein